MLYHIENHQQHISIRIFSQTQNLYVESVKMFYKEHFIQSSEFHSVNDIQSADIEHEVILIASICATFTHFATR